MAGALTISTLNNDTGVLATQNGMTGIPKAWVKFSISGAGVVTVNGNFNFSSITRTSQGICVFTFTTNLPDANYSVVTSQGLDPSQGTPVIPVLFRNTSGNITPTTSSFTVAFVAPSTGGLYDPAVTGLVVNGN